MACGQCATGGCGNVNLMPTDGKTDIKKTAGCSSGGCSSGGCTKLNTFDWLSDMEIPSSMQYNVVEVKFKGGRKGYFRNVNQLSLHTGDFVVCEMASGYHIGMVSLQGELVRLQLIKKGIQENEEITPILRIATERDLEKHQQAINRDLPTMYRVRELVKSFNLNMKLSDVEYQSDNSKATFYYSAEDRVDFRELIKQLAGEFRIRVEMRQISLRQEAARIGGIGSCGRELCCSTWLTDFKSIPTAAARYQNLSLNPAKLSGQCGRLKCCLNYELETYVDALQGIPKLNKPLQTQKGEAMLQKTDIFRRLMWFSFKNDSNWYSISCDQVIKIIDMNAEGKKPMTLENLSVFENKESTKQTINNELDRLDKKLTQTRKFAKKKSRRSAENSERKTTANPRGKKEKEGATNERVIKQATQANSATNNAAPKEKETREQATTAGKNKKRRKSRYRPKKSNE